MAKYVGHDCIVLAKHVCKTVHGVAKHVGHECIVLCKTIAAYICAKLLAMIAFLSAALVLTNVLAFAPSCALILHLNLRLNFAP